MVPVPTDHGSSVQNWMRVHAGGKIPPFCTRLRDGLISVSLTRPDRTHTPTEAAPLASGLLKGKTAQNFFPASYHAIFASRDTGRNKAVNALTYGSSDDNFPPSFTFRHRCHSLTSRSSQGVKSHLYSWSRLSLRSNTRESEIVQHENAEAVGGIETLSHLKE